MLPKHRFQPTWWFLRLSGCPDPVDPVRCESQSLD